MNSIPMLWNPWAVKNTSASCAMQTAVTSQSVSQSVMTLVTGEREHCAYLHGGDNYTWVQEIAVSDQLQHPAVRARAE
jgi:hypothetical protein